ncbi:oxygenase MpaB family protein [Pseudonocardia spinosispora]|uniref:oxygenase MpaB family protein n=1 Tax=Pseudonocardia spinosispora TaxID=103441 RepID=UPI00048A91B9|nr:oxygenase MpaB family protein [Pseudonocardia spinosispora]
MAANAVKAGRAPREWTDYGFFGPGSPTWKVWTAPTALLGFQRSVVLEHFDPFLAAAVADSAGIYTDPRGRLDRTLAYFLTVAVADSRTAIEASEILMRVHAKVTGIEPLSGKRYNANNPESQLWIHVTGWHSVLKCYEMFGPGPLSPGEEQRYWDECVVAAELQTCKPADVPRSREQVREYYAAVRPRLLSSERAEKAMHYLLRTPRKDSNWTIWAGSRVMARATIATLPKWMRTLGHFDQPAVVSRGLVGPGRIASRVVGGRAGRLAALRLYAPSTGRLMAQHLDRGIPALPETVTPARARDLYGAAARQQAETLIRT